MQDQKLKLSRAQGSERETIIKEREGRALETQKAKEARAETARIDREKRLEKDKIEAENRAKEETIKRENRAAERKQTETELKNQSKANAAESKIIGNLENAMIKPLIREFNKYSKDVPYFYKWNEEEQRGEQIKLPMWPPSPSKSKKQSQVTMDDIRKTAKETYGDTSDDSIRKTLQKIGVWLD